VAPRTWADKGHAHSLTLHEADRFPFIVPRVPEVVHREIHAPYLAELRRIPQSLGVRIAHSGTRIALLTWSK